MPASDIDSVIELLAGTIVEQDVDEVCFSAQGIKLDDDKIENATPIVDAIAACKCMKALRLDGNTMGVEAAKVIGKTLEQHPEFERAIWFDMFTGRLKSEIPDALRHLGRGIMAANARLVELDLSDNAFGPNGMRGLQDILTSPSVYTLRELRLNNNGLGVTGGKMLASCLLECHKSSLAAGTPLQLRVFVSGRGRLENEGSRALAEAFKAMGSLEEVSMPQNGINHEGITALADAFAHCPNLQTLNLNDNTVTEVGAKALAKALHALHKLKVLNLGDCLLRTGGAKVIAKALSSGHSCLTHINCSFNEIREEGGVRLAHSMAYKDQLDKLELDGNQLGEAGVDAVREVMEEMGRLDRLGPLDEDEGESDAEDDEDECSDAEDDAPTPASPIAPGREEKVSAADFLAFPSPRKLLAVENRGCAVLESLGEEVGSLEKAVSTFMKVSSIVTIDDLAVRGAACECVDAVLSAAVRERGEDAAIRLANEILVQLGLLKSESKRAAPTSISGALIVLEHAVKQKYFSKDARNILQIFISRPHPLLEGPSASCRHQLMQALFAF